MEKSQVPSMAGLDDLKDKHGYSKKKYLLFRKELANHSPSVPSALKLELKGELLYLCPENDLSGLSAGKGHSSRRSGRGIWASPTAVCKSSKPRVWEPVRSSEATLPHPKPCPFLLFRSPFSFLSRTEVMDRGPELRLRLRLQGEPGRREVVGRYRYHEGGSCPR